MSIKLMSEIWDNDDKELVGSKLIVLLCLADHANDDGVCWPSIGRLAKRARIDRRNVTNHVNDLEAMGYITVEHRPGNRNIYNVSPKRTHDASIIPTHDTTVIPTHDASIIGGMMPASYKPSVNHQLEPSVEPSVTPVSQAQPPMLTRKFVSAIDPQLHDEILVALNGSAPTVSPRTEKKERKPREPKVTTLAPNANNYHREMFTALATLCKVDPKLKHGQLNAASKRLREAGYDPASLDKFANWWYSQDFRGQQGKPPSIGQVEELILQATQWVPWTPPAVPAKKNGPGLDALRSWHYQYCYEQWNDHVAASFGLANPNIPGAFRDWYDNEARIPDDRLADWHEQQLLIKSKEMNQW